MKSFAEPFSDPQAVSLYADDPPPLGPGFYAMHRGSEQIDFRVAVSRA